MTGQPGDGCDDPRTIHHHWCGFCGAKLAFSKNDCESLLAAPPCPRCGEQQWRTDIDELTAPNYTENP